MDGAGGSVSSPVGTIFWPNWEGGVAADELRSRLSSDGIPFEVAQATEGLRAKGLLDLLPLVIVLGHSAIQFLASVAGKVAWEKAKDVMAELIATRILKHKEPGQPQRLRVVVRLPNGQSVEAEGSAEDVRTIFKDFSTERLLTEAQ